MSKPAARVIPTTRVAWGQPAVPTLAPPSWLAMARVRPEPPPPSSKKPGKPSLVPPSSPAVVLHRSSPPSARAASILPAPRGSGSFAAVQTAREVELEGEVAKLEAEVARLSGALASVRAKILEESEPEMVALSLSIARRIVGQELSADPSLIGAWITEGLAALPKKDDLTVALAPDLASTVERLGIEAHRILVDASLHPGTCELRQGSTTIEIGKDARLAAVADALGVDHR
jgi:hypothetical protein